MRVRARLERESNKGVSALGSLRKAQLLAGASIAGWLQIRPLLRALAHEGLARVGPRYRDPDDRFQRAL